MAATARDSVVRYERATLRVPSNVSDIPSCSREQRQPLPVCLLVAFQSSLEGNIIIVIVIATMTTTTIKEKTFREEEEEEEVFLSKKSALFGQLNASARDR